MKTRSLISVVLMAVALMSCRGRETSLTGGYGNAVVAGQVIMGGELASSSPSGVEVAVVGTGMMTTLGDDGRFAFVGVPEGAELRFFRADGVNAALRIERPSPSMVIELAGNSASSSRRRGAAQKLEYEGVIRTVTADKLVIFTSHKEEVEFVIDSLTLIRKGNTAMTAADLQPDWRVHVKATTKDNTKLATLIIVQNTGEDDDDDDDRGANMMTANGPVTAIDPLKVMSQSRGEVTVQTDANTIIKKQGVRITVDQIKVGDEINALGTRVDDHTLLARQIEVRGNSKKR